MKTITKAVIPAAGLGTRMLPATKAIPKEMLPIVDKPVIQYVVEECVASGIKEIIIVKNPYKDAIVNHFCPNAELETHLERSGKLDLLADIKILNNLTRFHFIDQTGPYGNATPVVCAKELIGDEAFVTIWGDEFFMANPPRLKQMIDVYQKYGNSVISGIKIKNKNELSKYGIAKVKNIKDNVYEILQIVEKPEPGKAPSNLATHGAYLFTPEIFTSLENISTGKSGELWLVDAINDLMKRQSIYTCEIKNATYYDTGCKLNYLKTNVEIALKDKVIGSDFRKYLRGLKL